MGTRIEQLERQVEVLREACEMLTKAYALRVDEKPVAGMRCLADATALLGKADRIAAEPAEPSDWETVIVWLLDGSSRFIQLENDRKAFHFFADDAAGSFDSVQSFIGEPTPHRCVAQMAAWVREQGGGK